MFCTRNSLYITLRSPQMNHVNPSLSVSLLYRSIRSVTLVDNKYIISIPIDPKVFLSLFQGAHVRTLLKLGLDKEVLKSYGSVSNSFWFFIILGIVTMRIYSYNYSISLRKTHLSVYHARHSIENHLVKSYRRSISTENSCSARYWWLIQQPEYFPS